MPALACARRRLATKPAQSSLRSMAPQAARAPGRSRLSCRARRDREPRAFRKARPMLRTHTCGDLNAATIGTSVALCGWIDTVREHANVLFVMLRDRYGIVQAVLEKSATEVPKLSRESVWRFEGEV